MSANPDFVVQGDTSFTAIRYYTAQDPYYYTVDNRPLQDIETNLKADRAGGSDAGRRAALFNSLVMSGVMQDLYNAPTSVSSATKMMTGLGVNMPSTNLIRISPGSTYELRNVSATVTDLIMKQANLTKTVDFTLTAPISVGTSIVYTIEAQFVELTAINMATSQLPNLDSTNQFLPSTITHGELKLNMIVGSAAATGSEVPAATTSGNFPLYNLTLTQGVSAPRVWAHANAPYRKGFNKHSTPIFITGSNATSQIINEMSAITFSTTGTAAVMLPVNGSMKELNPYSPLKMKLTFSSSATGGNIAIRARYKGYQQGEAHTVVGTNSAIEAVAVTGATNGMQTSSTVTAIIPNTEFAAFIGGVWTINKEKLSLVLERMGDDVADTNTGTMNLFGVVLYQ